MVSGTSDSYRRGKPLKLGVQLVTTISRRIWDDPKPHVLLRMGHLVAFYTAYGIFGSIGVLTSLGSLIISFGFRSQRAQHFGQILIHYLFRFFVRYLSWCGLLRLEASDLRSLKNTQGQVLVANHPSLLDAVFIAARLPSIFCLMKASLARNLVLSGQSKLAGYVNNTSGVGLVRDCLLRIHAGSTLLVFPEGTRSNGRLESFKMGFALIAQKAQVPIQTVFIRYDHRYLGKGWPFFRPPPFPLNCSITLGKRFEPSCGGDAVVLGRTIERYLRNEVDHEHWVPPLTAHV